MKWVEGADEYLNERGMSSRQRRALCRDRGAWSGFCKGPRLVRRVTLSSLVHLLELIDYLKAKILTGDFIICIILNADHDDYVGRSTNVSSPSLHLQYLPDLHHRLVATHCSLACN